MKTAVVTGSTKGIGLAIGMELLRRGCEVAFHYHRDAESAERLKNELNALGFAGKYQIVQADLSSVEGMQVLGDALEPRFHKLDYLVLNAASTKRGSLQELKLEDWEYVLRLNLTVPLFLTQLCAAWMQPGGCVLFSGAVMGQFPHALSLPYGTSKAAVHYLTKALVKEFADRGVRVNSVAPGFVETEWQKNKPQEIRRSIESKIALHRFAEPDEIARLAVEVLENPYINGSIVNIDGGYCFQ